MSIKSIHRLPADIPSMEVVLTGTGRVSISLVDDQGRALMTKRWSISGPAEVAVRTRLPLSLGLSPSAIAVIPVLTFQTNAQQEVTFMGRDHNEVTYERSRALGLAPSALEGFKVAQKRDEEGLWTRSSPLLPSR